MKYNARGNAVFVTGDAGRGLYSASGATRVTIVTGTTPVGAYAPDGSLNIVLSSLGYGYYHPCGAIRVTPVSTQLGPVAPDGSLYAEGVTAASVLLSTYSPTNGLVFSTTDNSLSILDSVTPSNNFAGKLVNDDGTINKFTFTRASTATYTQANGLLGTSAINRLRLDYSQGYPALFIESAATNLFLNSLLDGTNLSTQDVTVTAAAHTISFYGTGTITLSGVHVATVNGLGAYPTRTTLTFTPSAGTLTCTVSGTVQYAQVETGALATSYIPTAGATVTRAGDVMSIPTTLFNYDQSAGTLYFQASKVGPSAYSALCVPRNTATVLADRAPDMSMSFGIAGVAGTFRVDYVTATALQAALGSNNAFASGTLYKMATAAAANDFSSVLNGGTPATDNAGTLPGTVNIIEIGHRNNLGQLNGFIVSGAHFPTRLSNAQLQALTT